MNLPKNAAKWPILAVLLISGRVAFAADPSVRDYFSAQALSFGQQHREKVFLAQDKNAGFTFFSPEVADVKAEGNALSFRVTAKKATLGWGNYMGKQPVAERPDLWAETNWVSLRMKHSSTKPTALRLQFWVDGQREKAKRGGPEDLAIQAEMKGTDWQDVAFQPKRPQLVIPDGFEVEMEGEEGNRIQIESVKVIQPVRQGYVRKEFELPAGAKVWKAVAEVGSGNDVVWYSSRIQSELHVNGKKVARRGSPHIYQTSGVDIAPYLKPGKNCIGFYGSRIGSYDPFIYFQAKIVLTTGEVLTWATDTSWRWSPGEAAGWSQPGFDDRAWKEAAKGSVGDTYLNLGDIPAHQGLVELRNPVGARLVFKDTQPVVLEVRVPEGLAGQRPVVDYALARVEKAKVSPLASAQAATFTKDAASLVYALNLGPQPRGVYTVELKLKAGDNVLEERPREPLLVVGRIPMKDVPGDTHADGLDLELEDTIDFTNPQDPHPSFESQPDRSPAKPALAITTPKIVRKGALAYREGAAVRGAGFSYRFQFKRPGSFYLLELEYPDDAERHINVSVSTKMPSVWSNSQSGLGVVTGDKHPLTNTTKTLRWLHVADSGVHSLDVFSEENMPCAAKLARIHRVKGSLPALKISRPDDERLFGIHTERCYLSSGIGMNFGVDEAGRSGQDEAQLKKPLLERHVARLLWCLETAENYTQYLRFCGQNVHVMGCYQYDDRNTPFLPPSDHATHRVAAELREVLANVFDANGIAFFAGVEFSQKSTCHSVLNDSQVARGADTTNYVSSKGEQLHSLMLVTYPQNYFHPQVREAMLALADDLAQKFGYLASFRGVHFLTSPDYGQSGYYPPAWTTNLKDPFLYSYDDVTFGQFARDTGLTLPTDARDPARFTKRHLFATSPAVKKAWTDWRCRQVHRLLLDLRDRLKANRKDLTLMTFLPLEDRILKEWGASGQPYLDFLRDFGLDPTLYRADDGLWFGRWTVSWRQGKESHGPLLWQHRVSPDAIAAYDRDHLRNVFVRSSWFENIFLSPGSSYGRSETIALVPGSDWIMTFNRGRGLPQPNADNGREAYLQALITADPDALIAGFTDLNINVGQEQETRAFVRAYRALPRDRFAPALQTGLKTNLAIRELRKGGDYFFYVANPGYWPIKGTLTLKTSAPLLDLASDREAPAKPSGGTLTLSIALKPYSLAAYKTSDKAAAIQSYQTEPLSAPDLAHLTGILSRVKSLLAKPEARVALTMDEVKLMTETVRSAEAALASQRYAEAWALVTDHRFWITWKDYLEKAAAAALLPYPPGEPAKLADVRVLPVVRAATPPTLDGRLTDAVWQKAAPSAGFVTPEGRPALAQTAVRAAHDQKALYFAFECADREPQAIQSTATDEMALWPSGDDAIAIFLQPDEQRPLYCQLAFNAAGLQFDQKVLGGQRDYAYHPDWKVATAVGQAAWTAEVAIPFAAFDMPGKGSGAWRANFYRRFRQGLVPATCWSPLAGATDWHTTERFGRLVFE